MKRYWVAATILLVGVWPSDAKAYVPGADQSKADETPAQQAQSPNPSANSQGSDQAKEPSVAAKTTATTNAAANPANPSAAASQQKGSYLLVELTKSLKAKKLKPGDKVKAEVTQDVISHGKVIIPVETELIGHVTEVSVRDDATTESRLGIVFDRILLKHYHDINIQAVIQAVEPPAARPSRVDQPSQMLPPSMVGGGPRQGSVSPMGGGVAGAASTRGQVTPSASSGMSGGTDTSTFTTPLTVKQSPANSASNGSAAVQLEVNPGGKPMSLGMPQGVRGIKGLSLAAASASTPGPVIVSNTDNVKLDSGTQILLHILTLETPKDGTKPK
jgi:biotin carboxyl carrier protein